jgi:hypothetical protein
MIRSGVADQPERTNQFLRPLPFLMGNLLDIFRPGANLRAIFRQVAWLYTACNLQSQIATQLRTLWRAMARDITISGLHPKPHKGKAPRPF